MQSLRDQSNANKEVLKSRTKSMVDQVDLLRDRYENLEKRRKGEAEGYQADINLLKQKLRHVEQQLIRSAVTKTKGKLIFWLTKQNHSSEFKTFMPDENDIANRFVFVSKNMANFEAFHEIITPSINLLFLKSCILVMDQIS